jgi:hypothetical protein
VAAARSTCGPTCGGNPHWVLEVGRDVFDTLPQRSGRPTEARRQRGAPVAGQQVAHRERVDPRVSPDPRSGFWRGLRHGGDEVLLGAVGGTGEPRRRSWGGRRRLGSTRACALTHAHKQK